MKVMGIDPGKTGAIIVLHGQKMECYEIPIKGEEIDFLGLQNILVIAQPSHIFLERAIPFAQGMKAAFSYGRVFAAIEIAVAMVGLPVTYVEPAKWTKVLHQGIDANLKAKAKSLIAVERLFSKHLKNIPTNKKGAPRDGYIDALLIAEYGRRMLAGDKPARVKIKDDEFDLW